MSFKKIDRMIISIGIILTIIASATVWHSKGDPNCLVVCFGIAVLTLSSIVQYKQDYK